MTDVVIDASALLAMHLGEPGAEIVSFYAEIGAARTDVESLLRPLPIIVAPLYAALSYDAGLLRPLTVKGGLSLGDRHCLALAEREGRPALTAERRWPDVAAAAGVGVTLGR